MRTFLEASAPGHPLNRRPLNFRGPRPEGGPSPVIGFTAREFHICSKKSLTFDPKHAYIPFFDPRRRLKIMKSLTPRQERFCHAFVHYANGAHAAREAGYRPKWAKCRASWLLKTERIRTRVQDIQAGLARDHGRDRDVLIGKLETVYRRAIEEHQFYSAARAVELQAKLAGFANVKPAQGKAKPEADLPAPPAARPRRLPWLRLAMPAGGVGKG